MHQECVLENLVLLIVWVSSGDWTSPSSSSSKSDIMNVGFQKLVPKEDVHHLGNVEFGVVSTSPNLFGVNKPSNLKYMLLKTTVA